MLALFSFAALVAFCGVGTGVGWKVLRLARATGGAPERWIGLCLIGICALGYPILIAGQALPSRTAQVAAVCLGIGTLNFGLLCIFLFTRCVFRPAVPWLRHAVGLAAAALTVHWLGMTASSWIASGSTPEAAARASSVWTLGSCVISSIGFGWTAVEALSYWSRLRLRVPLGLADPLVVNRLVLWACVGISSTLINASNAVAVLRGLNVLQDPATMIATGVLGSVNSVALWLAFLPPASYAARVRRGAPGPTTR